MRGAAALSFILLAACATKPPPVTAIINCPPPPVETMVNAPQLPEIPPVRPDAQDAIAVLSRIAAADAEAYEIEVGKRRSLIQWGRDKCNW
jgi:hypothetical protein